MALDRLGICGHFAVEKGRKYTNAEIAERNGITVSDVKEIGQMLKELLGDEVLRETSRNVSAFYEPSIKKPSK